MKINTDTNLHNMRVQRDSLQRVIEEARSGIEQLEAAIAKREQFALDLAARVAAKRGPQEVLGLRYPEWANTPSRKTAYRKQLDHAAKIAARGSRA